MKRTTLALSIALLCALARARTAASSIETGVPLLYRSSGTMVSDPASFDPISHLGLDGSLPVHLVASPGGRTEVSFRTPEGALGRYAYLGFHVEMRGGPIVVSITPEVPVPLKLFVSGGEIAPLQGSPGDYLVPAPELWEPGRQFGYTVRIRFELGSSPSVPVTVRLRKWEPCANDPSPTCGHPVDERPDIIGYGGRISGIADVTVPAVLHKDGFHGPIRTDLSFTNHSGVDVMAILQLVGSVESSDSVPLWIPAGKRTRVTDVASHLLAGMAPVPDEGVLLIRGFVPGSAGDLTAETYYEGGSAGRVGASLPIFVEAARRRTGILATSSTAGDPRLTIYSSLTGGLGDQRTGPMSFVVRVHAPDGSTQTRSFQVEKAYVSYRLSEYGLWELQPDGYFTVESQDPTLRVLVVASDPVSGSPTTVIAGPPAAEEVP